jgi:iron complex outermembrane receptor protein
MTCLYDTLIAKSNGSQYAKDGEPAAYQIGVHTVTDFTAGYRWRVAFDQYTFVPARSWTVSLNADF